MNFGGEAMPLLDHFHAPVFPEHSWESFHVRWAAAMSDELNRTLPPRYMAETYAHIGTYVSADVAEFERQRAPDREVNGAGGVAVQTWAPPTATLTVPITFPDEIEVHVYDMHRDKRLVAAIELVSPSNKDEESARQGLAAKCVACLHRGIGILMVDVVTSRGGNLHQEVMEMLGQAQSLGLPSDVDLYAVAYHPAQRGERSELDVWSAGLALGQALPTLPLALRGAFFVPVDLEATYMEARRHCRL
jgi:hypothetical protein